MVDGWLRGVFRRLRDTALLPDGEALSDGQLLARFLRERDESAFEGLVRRYGPMVLGVCRRLLGNCHDTDDAFQTTFLVLVRKGATVVPGELVGHWLYGVAYRTAIHARRLAARRRTREKQVEQMPEPGVVDPESFKDLRAVLDQELSRLPEVYRVPVVLCELAGQSKKEVAQRLGVPEGTVSSRLARGRELLRQRLVRRGLTLSAGALVLSEAAASAAVPAALLRATVQAALLVAGGRAAAGGLAAPVARLLRAVCRDFAVARCKTAALVLLVLGLLGLAAGLVVRQTWPQDPPADTPVAAPVPQPAEAPRPPVEDPQPPAFVRIADFDNEKWVNLQNFVHVNDTLFFTASSNSTQGQLWKCSATPNGVRTTQLSNLRPNLKGGQSTPLHLTNVNGTLFFLSRDGERGWELWKSDGTPAGTVPVMAVNPGGVINPPPQPGGSSLHLGLMAAGKTLFFVADNGEHGYALRKSDGTAAGTVVVKQVNACLAVEKTSLRAWADVNGTLFFAAWDGARGQELWKSDGTAEGTVLVKDIAAGPRNSNPCLLTDVNGTLFFTADDGVHGRELWKSDGTAAGTKMVKDIRPGRAGGFPEEWMGNLTNVNGTLFFMADDGVHGLELWKSDGTEEGTVLVKDIHPGPHSSVEWRRPGDTAPPGLGKVAAPGSTVTRHGLGSETLAVVNGTLFFVADDGKHGYELWRSDGTPGGTFLVKDIAPGDRDAHPRWLTNVNGTLYFHAGDGVHYRKLWKSDGTRAGTVSVKDFIPNDVKPTGNDDSMGFMTAVGGGLFFTAARWGPEVALPGQRLDLWYMTAPRQRPG
jgi:RNA polymerase sigma factor (sigma-70 family)